MFRRRFRRQDDFSELRRDVHTRLANFRKFSYESLQIATNNFSKDMLIGQGGYARVYKGVLSNGIQVAVKYLSHELSQRGLEEFSNMAEAMLQMRHRNIVQAFGCCIEKDRLLLVTEYVPNGSLRDLLEIPERRESSDFKWRRRSAICIDIARGLLYLHKDAIPRVIHMDIKPSNILLDHNFTPKISDFDLVRFFYDLEESELPHQTVHIAGTYGYIDPEFILKGEYSDKSDVFAFGVVMLQLISGRRAVSRGYPNGETHITHWASKLVKIDNILGIIDPVLLTDLEPDEALSFIDVALSCIQRDPKLRRDMLEVTHMLYGLHHCSRFLFKRPDMSMLYDGNGDTFYYQDDDVEGQNESPASDTEFQAQGEIEGADTVRSSITKIDDDGEGEAIFADSELQLQLSEVFLMQEQGEIEGADNSAAQSNTTTMSQVLVQQQQQHMGIILSGSGDLVERLSQTTVFKKSTKLDFPEAVYPPFRTRVFRRGGSRNLYTF